MKKTNGTNGFTLIELLIVVLVISVLSGVTLGVLNSGGFRQKARDSQRIADLKKIQSALEFYYADNRGYPKASAWASVESGLGAVLSPTYVNNLPSDPTGSTGADPCSGATTQYYSYITDNPTGVYGTKYVLTARMEVSSSDDDNLCSALNNWSGSMSCSIPSTVYCYGAENP